MLIIFKANEWKQMAEKYNETSREADKKLEDLQRKYMSPVIEDIMLEMGNIKSI